MFCSKCEKEISDKSVICIYCGCPANNLEQKNQPIINNNSASSSASAETAASTGSVRCKYSFLTLQMKKIIISKKIKDFRRKNHLTQSQFADLFGITAQSVSKWEREECYPDITFLPVLAEAIGCMIDDFFA